MFVKGDTSLQRKKRKCRRQSSAKHADEPASDSDDGMEEDSTRIRGMYFFPTKQGQIK